MMRSPVAKGLLIIGAVLCALSLCMQLFEPGGEEYGLRDSWPFLILFPLAAALAEWVTRRGQ